MIKELDVWKWKEEMNRHLRLPCDLSQLTCNYLFKVMPTKPLIPHSLCIGCELFILRDSLTKCQIKNCNILLHKLCLECCTDCKSKKVYLCRKHELKRTCIGGPVCSECHNQDDDCEECGHSCCHQNCERCDRNRCSHCGGSGLLCDVCDYYFCENCVQSCDFCDQTVCAGCKCPCYMDETP
jgi:hypothetical protein